ncbi:MAG: divergent PAP2 family protein [Nanoarchaeota archaeon]|nr:divergent PAP2 family protein [Nanoarchaeota archaeon]MBU1704268.1 divergent PAP2 family protein [Nanoarchaeota archaeon]
MAMLNTHVLLAFVLGYAVPQLIKILIIIFKHKQKFRLNDLIVTGGMPSVHSSIVISLVTIIALTEGYNTTFFLAAAFAAVVLRDAMGVRRTAGEEGMILNQVIKKTRVKVPRLHYSLGHTPAQVLVGSFVGLMTALLIFFLR